MPTTSTLPAGAAERGRESINGPVLAAVLAAGIGTFALGLIVLLNEAGAFTVPAVYGPAGGVSGRTTFAVAAWLLAWAFLHVRWRNSQMGAQPVFRATLALIGLGVLATLPPVWALF